MPPFEKADCEKKRIKKFRTRKSWQHDVELGKSIRIHRFKWPLVTIEICASFCFAFASQQKHDPKYSEKRSLLNNNGDKTGNFISFSIHRMIVMRSSSLLIPFIASELNAMKWNGIEWSRNLKIAQRDVRSTAHDYWCACFDLWREQV